MTRNQFIKYPLDYNPIIEYHNKIQSNEIIVSKKVKRVYEELARRIYDENYEYEYSAKHANHAIEFIENFCKHSKGKFGGKPFILELWQKALVAATFGFIHKVDELRLVRELILVVARKNGKSAVASAISLYMLLADGEAGAEVYSVATKKDQAKIVWNEAKRMVNKSPALKKRVRSLVGELVVDSTDSSFKPLSSESNTLDGLNVHASVTDELHAITDKNLYDVIVDGMTAREQPLSIITTTAGTVREGIFDIKYEECEKIINGYDDGLYKDDRVLPIIYELDNPNEWQIPENWFKANPALGTVKNIDELARKVEKAKSNPKLVKNLLTKDFNIRETSESAWLTFNQINNEATFDITELKPRYAIGGVDLSHGGGDLTSACIAFMLPSDDTIYFKHMYWIPADLLQKKIDEDNIPYDVWVEQGLVRLCEGNYVHPKYVTEWFVEVQNTYDCYLYKIGYDAWSAKYWVEDMENYFGQNVLEPVIQGKKTLSIPMEKLGLLLDDKKINYENNPITKWCLMNTAIDMDKNGNIQPVKHKGRKRIDGLAAMLDAYVILHNNINDYKNII